MLGTRGIPARYGGFETCVEQVSVRLASRGHDVTVYCRSDYPGSEEKSYKGVRLVHLPRLRKSFLETPFNSLAATVHAVTSSYDVLHYFGGGNVPFLLVPRVMGARVVLTVDGLEWKRMSYSQAARTYLRLFAELATVLPNRLVADSPSSERWYLERTGMKPWYIPYGIQRSSRVNKRRLQEFGLEEDGYILFVGRLVYEKGAHTLVEAFKSVPGDLRLVIIGDSATKSNYVDDMKKNSDCRTMFLGYVFGEDYEAIRDGSRIFVHPSLLDGTSISLLSAIASGLCIVSSNLSENIEVAGDSAVYFQTENAEDLARELTNLIADPSLIDKFRKRAREKATTLRDWDSITDSYESLYTEINARISQ